MSMTKIAVAATVASLAGAAHAQDLLIIDLTSPNQITISATANAASANASGSTFTGVYMDNLFGNGSVASLGAVLVSGNLTPASIASDNSPSLFNSLGNAGLNLWSYSATANHSFTAGQQAFTGSATWNISAGAYADLLDGSVSGDIYFPADTDDDLGAATVIGQYRVIPSPTALALLGVGGLVGAARRRR